MRAAAPVETTDEQRAILDVVREFVEREILPAAGRHDEEDSFPTAIVEQMRELGLFGVVIPEEYGGMDLDTTTYAMIVEELSRGWMSISGVLNTHFIGSYLLKTFGTPEQRARHLPRMATGEVRSAFALSEPGCGSDVQAIRTRAERDPAGGWRVSGQKMWTTNGLRAGIVFLLCVTDPAAEPRHRGMTCMVVEKEPGRTDAPGLTIPPKIRKMGYRGLETTELVFDEHHLPGDPVLGGEEAGLGRGFAQVMDALELGRVNIAARGVGAAQRALELALRYSQERRAFGKPIARHQAILFKLAEMATKVEAARLLLYRAARLKDEGVRSDMEAGMAKLFASEAALECTIEAFRIHGGYGYSKEFEVERLYRDVPLLVIGEGTSEIQKLVIGRELLKRNST